MNDHLLPTNTCLTQFLLILSLFQRKGASHAFRFRFTGVTRFVALDLHRTYLVVGAVDVTQHIVLTPRRFGFEAFWAWASEHLLLSDAVILEARTNAWEMHDCLAPLVASVTVAHSSTVKLLASARIKTDARDTIKLAQLLAARRYCQLDGVAKQGAKITS